MTQENSTKNEWAFRLFNKSPLKQRKFKKIVKYLPDLEGKRCLDIGSDNGVISALLRKRGGSWASADLIPETVASIKSLVETDVHQIDGISTPFKENEFDIVVIVDLLEHIETDKEFIAELHRILKSDGLLIVNVPNPKEGLLRKIRFAIGQTDEAHGHVRPGYTLKSLQQTLHPNFDVSKYNSYGRVFSELVDTAITGALYALNPGGKSQKGSVVTGKDLKKLEKSFKFYSLLYPFFKLCALLDEAVPFLHGNMLIAQCFFKANNGSLKQDV